MTLAMQEEVVDAEIVLSKIEALQLVEDIRQLANNYVATRDALLAKLEYARDTNAHEQIEGCKSYGDFIAHVFSGIPIKWSREDRRVLVADMAFHEKGGMSTRQIGAALGVGKSTVDRDIATVPNGTDEPRRVSSSDGKTRTYTTTPQPEPDETLNVDKTTGEIKENDVEVTDYHHTPYAEGYVLFRDGGARTVSVGKDGRAHSHGTMQKAIDWARANPSEKNYDAAKASGISQSYITGAYASLRKNREIHAVNSTGRRPHEEFGVLATGVKHLGMSVEKFLTEGTIDFIEPDEIDYYMDGLKEGMAQLVKFQRAARALHKSGQQ